ncbi:uncharacterized protein LOC101455054 [Ceratitis capitata]|uniref:uncharacterized protein LOC101455054 n=1 Tax=Ceratitis capitata TaxID=7213 RepID=UPI000C6C4622|nr:uncharacterized protein LOC101455054 [Ceratitis capitata]
MLGNVEFAAEYKRIEYYIAKGYARKLSATEAGLSSPKTWYLPHFAVSNPNKPGKLRLVFDAAAEVEGVSLNAHLLKGPQNYKSLPSILFHFRQGAMAVSGDIKEMFHQILVQPEDRCAQRFLWRNGESNRRPEVYEVSVMIFGAACSPCAAHYIKTVNALEHRSDHKNVSRAVKSILEHHYVDDMVDSFGSVEEAITVSEMVRAIHLKAGFELRNFASNSQKVMSEIGGKEITRAISKKEGVLVEKVLGLFWQSSTDCFRFQLKFNKVDAAVINGTRFPTKRELLSVVMSIFDPLGFLCNFVVGAKVIMREVWKHNIHWDEPLPSDINDAWERWRNQLTAVVKYTIPRFYFLKGMPKILQLHVFVDASEVAFAAVAYWRSESFSGEIDVSFISAKSKCAPIKPLTVPRLELQAAVLGSRLMNNIRKEHSLDISQCVPWTDSKTVVSWIRCEHRRYKPFVQHRIAEILTATDATQWKWLPTDSNVADEATRTNNRIDFRPTGRWTSGPAFLHQSQDHWPGSNIELSTEDPLEEELRHKYALVIVHTDIFEFKRFSTFMKLVRVAAWVLRFIHICRRRMQPETRYGLTAGEIKPAKKLLCRFVQEEAFTTEIQPIKNGQNITSNSTLLQFSPYIDEEGVLRVNGRIDAASWLPVNCRHPIILPQNHHFTRLVMHYHKIMRHQNHEATICKIRLSFWISRLRTLLRSVVGN